MIKVKQSKGFTLIELLVSLAILILILGAAVSVEVKSVKQASTNEFFLQATNLAQQRLNFAKTIRDQNILDGKPPFDGWDSSCDPDGPNSETCPVIKAPVFAVVKKSNGLLMYGTTYYYENNKVNYTINTEVTDVCNFGVTNCDP